MKYDFTNKAIKCDTWEQMRQLSEFARSEGETVASLNIEQFEDGAVYFSSFTGSVGYSNFWESKLNETVISYSDFISNNNTKK